MIFTEGQGSGSFKKTLTVFVKPVIHTEDPMWDRQLSAVLIISRHGSHAAAEVIRVVLIHSTPH